MASKGLFGIFFISAASLMLEVSLMRFFSIMEFYHFAFLAVGVALFGGAAAGTYIFVKEPKDPLFRSCLLFSASALASFVVLNRMSFDPVRASVDWWHLLRLIPYYLLLSLPFFFSGMVLAYSFKVWQSDSARVYLFNLVGAAVGALGVLFLIASLGEHAIRAVCLMGVFGGVFFAKNRKDAISLFVLSVIILMAPLEIRMSQYKDLSRALNHPGAELLDTRWNGFSRVDLANGSFARYAPGLSMQYRMLLPQQMGVFIDGQMVGAFTCGEDLRFMDYLPSSIGYGLGFENPRTLILDSGAGMDVQAAKRNGAKVTAIDANPSVADLARGEYSHFTGGVYEGIDVHVGHPRSFLKTGEKFDIIVLSPGGGSFGSGIHGLNENYLLTVDAFRQYHEHLDEGGVLVITRWLDYPPREAFRLFSMALEIDPQGDEIVMFRSWTTVTLLISRGGFGPDRISAIDAFIRDMRFDYIHAPFDFTPNIFSVFDEPVYYGGTHAILNDPDTFYEGYLFDVSPVHDDRPFYFNFFRIDKAHELYGLLGESWMPFTDPGFILIFLLAQAAILSLAFLIFPIWFIKGGITEFKSIFFFFFIGLAYLFVELVFIQKFVLLMENIAYSASVVISAMLFFSGLGSYFSKNLKSRHVKMVGGLLFIIIAFYAEIVPHFVEGILGQSLIVRGILAAVFLAPLAFLMGMPFPTIIRSIDGRMVAWAWAVNGSASVLSAVLAILLGIIMGYNAVLILAAVLYLLSVMFV